MSQEQFNGWVKAHRDILEEVRQSAHELHAHVNQTYDQTKPYGGHLDMVAQSVYDYGYLVCEDEHDLLPLFFGAYYHDSIEDARLTYNDVMATAKRWMDDQQAYLAAEIVYALTNDKGRTREERAGAHYYQGIREMPYAPFVKLADRFANITYFCSSREGDNQHMREVYLRELPHFLEAIDARSSDLRFALPKEMISRILFLV